MVDLGYRQKVNPSRLMGVINDVMEGTKIRIGKIDMDKTFSRIDVEERYAVEIASRLAGAKTGSYTINAYFEEGENAKPHRSSRDNYGGGRLEDRNRRGAETKEVGLIAEIKEILTNALADEVILKRDHVIVGKIVRG